MAQQDQYYQLDNEVISSLSSPNEAADASKNEKEAEIFKNESRLQPPPAERRRQPRVGEQDARNAYFQLRKAGIEPTAIRLYEQLGRRGSMTTINRYLRQFEQERLDKETELKENSINREEVMQLAEELTRMAYLGNAEYLKQELNRAHSMVSSVEKGHRAECAEFCAKIDALNEKLQETENLKGRLNERLAQAVKDAAAANTARLSAETKLKALQEPFAEREAKRDKEIAELKSLFALKKDESKSSD